jgi:hypothetical protein
MSAPGGGDKAKDGHGKGAVTHRTTPATKASEPTSGARPGKDDSRATALGASPVRISTRTPKARTDATRAPDGTSVTKGVLDHKANALPGASEKDGKVSTTWLPANTLGADGNPGSPRQDQNMQRRGLQLLAPARSQNEKPRTLATLVHPTGSSCIVMKKGSWFNAILSYNAEKVLILSSTRMPAFVSAMPAALTGDGSNWIEVLMCVERSYGLANESGDYRMPSTAGKPIFRSNPQISWNGEAVYLYAVLAAFIKDKLGQTQLAKFIASACELIASEYPGMEYKRLEKKVTDKTNKSEATVPNMDILGKYIDAISNAALATLERIPQEVLPVLARLDHEIIKWALESGYAINEINAQRQNAIVQFFITRGISTLFTVPEGSIGAASVLRNYANKELNKLARKLTAPILKASSNLLPLETKARLDEMLHLDRIERLGQVNKASATKKAEGQKAQAERGGLVRAATKRGSPSSAPAPNKRELLEAKRKLLKAVRADDAFVALSDAAKDLLETEFGELKQKGLNAGKIETATWNLVERIRPESPKELGELEQYLAVLWKRRVLEALYGEATFVTLPTALQKFLKEHLDAMAPAGMNSDTVADAAKILIEGTSPTKEELSSIELFLPVLETGRWRPDYAVKVVENLFSDTWGLFDDASLDAGSGLDGGDENDALVPGMGTGAQPQPQSAQPRQEIEANAEVEETQQGRKFEWPENPFASDLTGDALASKQSGESVVTPFVERELEKGGREKS